MNTPYRTIYITIAIIVATLVVIGGFIFYRLQFASPMSNITASTTSEQIKDAYTKIIYDIDFNKPDSNLSEPLRVLRDIAADESKPVLERVQALNGINYGYTASNFNAAALYDVVFSKPPFDQYYIPPATSSIDIVHPAAVGDVESVEKAMVKLNELSNALSPNHYAITRMQLANIFASQRDTARVAQPQREAIRQQYAKKIETLREAYEALPGGAFEAYSTPLKIHMLYIQGSSLVYIGLTFKNKAYMQEGEKLFQDAIRLGEMYPKTDPEYVRVVNQTSFARVQYASNFWAQYKNTDPEHIEAVLLPLINDPDVRNTPLYTQNLPSHKAARVPPATVLRDIAKTMPELKAFLEEIGWKF